MQGGLDTMEELYWEHYLEVAYIVLQWPSQRGYLWHGSRFNVRHARPMPFRQNENS